MKKLITSFLLAGISALASDLTVTTGLAVTPNRQATEVGTWNQESRMGPTAGIEFRAKFLFAEANYVNTNTRLQNYALNTWTMHRVSLDGGIMHQWHAGRFTPFAKVGGGVMAILSGMDTNGTSAGNDTRIEGLAGLGIKYRLSHRFSAALEYEGRLIRNPDFADHSWKPQRNWLSEPEIGISYTFGRE